MSKTCHVFFQNKKQIFTISKPNIMKKSKYQHYFHRFIVCMLVPYAFWFNYQQNMVTVLWLPCGIYQRGGTYQSKLLISIWIRKGVALIRGNTVCGTKTSRFIKKQKANGLLSSLGIKIPLSKIPLLGNVFILNVVLLNDLIVIIIIL